MHSEFLSPSDPRWSRTLAHLRHDVYHLPEYVSLCARYERAKPLAFYAEEGDAVWLVPVLLRPLPEELDLPEEWCDLTSPYGYPCPVYSPSATPERTAEFLKAFCRAAGDLGACSIVLRLHPLLKAPCRVPLPLSAYVDHGETVFVDLTSGNEDGWQKIRRGHKSDIKRLENLGFSAEIDNWNSYDWFVRTYRQTMDRIGADPYYYFDDQYFAELRTALGDHVHLCCVLSPDGQGAAGGVFTTVDGIIEYHLSATALEFHRLAPTKLMLDAVRRWGKSRGDEVLHLGGGVGAQSSSLLKFKSGFSHLRGNYSTWRAISIESRYSVAVWRATRSLDLAADLRRDSFPPYRTTLRRRWGASGIRPTSGVHRNGPTVVLSSAGRRVGLARCFRDAVGNAGRIGAIDSSKFFAASGVTDSAWCVPSCRSNEFLPYVLDLCRRESVSLLVPTIDTELAIYSGSRQQFEAIGTFIFISSPETVAIARDKVATHQWLTEHGFPTVRQGSPVEVLDTRFSWKLPLIAKPRDGSASIGVQVIMAWEELDLLAQREGQGYIVQEFAPGNEYTVNVYVDSQGQCICTVPHRRIEVRGGEVSKAITVKDWRLMSVAQSIAEELPEARGPMNIQCFMTDSGEVNIIEINPRFGGGYPLAHKAGARFTHWMIDELEGHRVKRCDDWQDGLVMLRYDEAVYAPSSSLRTEACIDFASFSISTTPSFSKETT